MRILILFFLSLLLMPSRGSGQTRAVLDHIGTFMRADSLPIVFNLKMYKEKGSDVWVIGNAEERIRITDIRRKGDSIFVGMPVFESDLKLKATGGGLIAGDWVKGTTGNDVIQRVVIRPGSQRFEARGGKPLFDISGRWRVSITRPNGTLRPAMAEFRQRGQLLTGTFLTPSGDYRYLEGIVSGDSLQLSCFDGSHAYYFGARIDSEGKISNGVFAAGLTHLEKWSAELDAGASLDESAAAMNLRPGMERLGFRFPDLDSNMVSIRDERFRDKVVVVQIMGSWCPNCMDETAFLSEYYEKNRKRGLEVIALAYEYSTDFDRARKSLMKFRQRYQVAYPMLITGVLSSDTLRTEKTLPELTPIRAFPTTIFIGRDGKVSKIHAGFSGPATGVHFDKYKRDFEETVTGLLLQGN